MIFVGSYDLTIDPKNRLSIPSVVRSEFEKVAKLSRKRLSDADSSAVSGSDGIESLYLIPGVRRNVLAVYGADYFEASRAFTPPTEQLSPATQDWIRLEASLAARVEPDNQGRVLVPERLIRLIKLAREVTMVGAKDHYEIWNREEYAAFLEAHWMNYEPIQQAAQKELAPFRPPANGSRI